MRSVIGAVLTVLLVLPTGLHAQTVSAPPQTADRVDDARIGRLRASASRQAARVAATASRQLPARQAPPRRNWFARHPVLAGTLVGAGIGLGFVAAESCSSSDYTCAGLLTFFGGLGAGLGAGAGAIVGIVLR